VLPSSRKSREECCAAWGPFTLSFVSVHCRTRTALADECVRGPGVPKPKVSMAYSRKTVRAQLISQRAGCKITPVARSLGDQRCEHHSALPRPLSQAPERLREGCRRAENTNPARKSRPAHLRSKHCADGCSREGTKKQFIKRVWTSPHTLRTSKAYQILGLLHPRLNSS
jgi:hypothetical protein